MESFVSLLIGIKELISDGVTYLLIRLRKDRRFALRFFLGILLIILAFAGISSLLRRGKSAAKKASQDLESQMVIPIDMTVSQTPSPAPGQSSGSSLLNSSVGQNGLPGMNSLTLNSPALLGGGTITTAQTATEGTQAQSSIGTASGDMGGSDSTITTSTGVVVVNEYLQKKNGGSQVPIVQQNAQPSPLADYDYEATYFDGAVHEAGEAATENQGG